MGAPMRFQPQGRARINRSNPLTIGAQAIISAAQPVNLVSLVPLKTAGTITQGLSPNGKVYAFRKNGYVETETLPAIGTASFVEFWCGVPSTDRYAKGNSSDPGFLTGSGANQIGIIGSVGTNQSSANPGQWGAVRDWSSNNRPATGEVLAAGVWTVLVVVRRQTGMEFWHNGTLVYSYPSTPVSYSAQTMICGSFVEDTGYWPSSSDTMLAGRIVSEWTADQVKQFSANPWQLFDAGSSSSAYQSAIASIPAASGGTGSSTGNASITLGALTRTAAGSVAVAGAQSATLAPATMAAAGTLGGSATLSLALAPAGIASAASLALAAQASTALNPATLAAAATLGGGATLSLVLAPATASGAGSLAIGAASTRSFAPLAATSAATLAIGAQGVPSFAPATITADGNTTVARIGSLTVTLAPATFAGSAGVTTGAQLGATLAPAGVTGSVSAALGAAFARALSPLTASGAGSLPVAAVLSGALGAISLAAGGTRQLNAAFSNQLGALTLAANAGGLSGAGAVIYLGALLLAADAALTPLVFTPPPLLRALGLRYLMHRPYRKDRIVLLGKFIKQPAEREAYAIEYEDDLSVGDTLAQDQAPRVLIERTGSATGVDATPLTLTAIDVGSTRVTLWLVAGLDGALYKITVTATTASGRILQDEFTIRIKDY